MPAPRGIQPDTPVNFVKGVGPARSELLTNQGLRTALDLIYWFPLRHEDRNHVVTISELAISVGPVRSAYNWFHLEDVQYGPCATTRGPR